MQTTSNVSQDSLYTEAIAIYEDAIQRLVRAYEADADRRRDLSQEIHMALWRSFAIYEARCSTRTWVYRVAHHTAMTYTDQRRRDRKSLVSLEEVEGELSNGGQEEKSSDRLALERLLELIHRLKPFDRQLMLLYLEDLDASEIGEITGISAGNVRNKIHRIKAILARRFHADGRE